MGRGGEGRTGGSGSERRREARPVRLFKARVPTPVWGLEFRIEGVRVLPTCAGRQARARLWFRVQGSGSRAQGSGFRVQASGFRVQGPGFKVQGSRLDDERRVPSDSSRRAYLFWGLGFRIEGFRVENGERGFQSSGFPPRPPPTPRRSTRAPPRSCMRPGAHLGRRVEGCGVQGSG